LDPTLEEQPGERLAGVGALLALGFVLGIAAAYGFVWLAAQVVGQEIGGLDSGVVSALGSVRTPVLESTARALSFLGNEALYVIGAVLVGVFAWQRRWGAAVVLLLAGVGAYLLSNVLKVIFQRARPEPLAEPELLSYAFPSGHAMVSIAFYGCVGYLAWRLLPGARIWVLIALSALVLLIGASRVYLGVHYPTDVMAGFIAGFVWLDAVLIGGHILRARGARVS
jgi:membrane-associated phospholipid phosphatase